MSGQPPQHAREVTRTSSLPVSGAVLLGIVALAVLLVLGLVALVGPDGRAETLAWLSGIVASGLALTGVVQNRTLHAGVQKVQHQTNGSLDARILRAIDTALAQQAERDAEARELDATPEPTPTEV